MSSFSKKGERKNLMVVRKEMTNQLKYFKNNLNILSEVLTKSVEILEKANTESNKLVTEDMIEETVRLLSKTYKVDLSETIILTAINKLKYNYNLIELEYDGDHD